MELISCYLKAPNVPRAKFTVNNSGCKSTFQILFLIIFHTFFFFLVSCLSDVIRTTLFLPPNMVDKELVPGPREVSALPFFMSSCGFKLQSLIVVFVRVMQLNLDNITHKFT